MGTSEWMKMSFPVRAKLHTCFHVHLCAWVRACMCVYVCIRERVRINDIVVEIEYIFVANILVNLD